MKRIQFSTEIFLFLTFTVLGFLKNQDVFGQWTAPNTNPQSILVHTTPGPGVYIGKGAGTAIAQSLAIGTGAPLGLTTTGQQNTAIGSASMSANTTGTENTALGFNSLISNTTGIRNVSLGFGSMGGQTNSTNSTAVGWGALAVTPNSAFANMQNTAFGSLALNGLRDGSNNVAIGRDALRSSNTTQALSNVAVGSGALDFGGGTFTGNNNVAIGAGALAFNGQAFNGSNNIAIGSGATLAINTSNGLSIQNVIYGRNMSRSGATITGNIGIGIEPTIIPGTGNNYSKLYVAGNTTTEPSLQLQGVPTNTNPTGNYLFVDVNGVVRQTALPAAPTCSTSGFIPVYNNTGGLACSIIQQSTTLSNCVGGGTHSGIGIGGVPIATTTSGTTCYDLALTIYGSGFASGGLWIASDKKFKTNVNIIESAIEKISRLRGVSYGYDTKKYSEFNFPVGKTLGFIAQELEKVIPEAVSYTEKGFYAVNYDAVIPVLTEGIKEQQAQIEKQQTEIENLKSELAEFKKVLLNTQKTGLPNVNQTKLEVAPNPVTGVAVVSYSIEDNRQGAVLVISDLQGRLVKQIALRQSQGQVQVNKKELAAGIYVFSLISGNTEIQSKKVLVTE